MYSTLRQHLQPLDGMRCVRTPPRRVLCRSSSLKRGLELRLPYVVEFRKRRARFTLPTSFFHMSYLYPKKFVHNSLRKFFARVKGHVYVNLEMKSMIIDEIKLKMNFNLIRSFISNDINNIVINN